jgi:TonB family protein
MKKRLVAAFGLMVLTGGVVGTPRKLSAQDVNSEEGKRKIRYSVQPVYPLEAKQLNLSGKVKIEATIAADGHVISTTVIGGHPLLVNAALDALKKWRFEPAPQETTGVYVFEFNLHGS